MTLLERLAAAGSRGRLGSVAAGLAVVLGAGLAVRAMPHDLAAVMLARRLAAAGWIGPAGRMARTPIADSVGDVPSGASRSRVDPVLAPWWSLLDNENPERTARALLAAYDAGGGSARSLDALARARAPLLPPGSVMPRGLAEYEYALALRAMDQGDFHRAREHFARAVVCRPGPWPEDFVMTYRSAVAAEDAAVDARLAQEQAQPVDPLTQVAVGRKDQPGWRVPIAIERGWRLEGVAIRTPTALDLGLPVTVDLFWLGETGRRETRTVREWNMAPNGGFELRGAPVVGEQGWLQPQSIRTTSTAQVRFQNRRGQTSNVLFMAPLGAQSNAALSRPIPVNAGEFLLWHAWLNASDGGVPMFFTGWLNASQKNFSTEIPLQGLGTDEPEGEYAGVLSVPAGAKYLSLMLANWQGRGAVRWDDVLVIAVRPPS